MPKLDKLVIEELVDLLEKKDFKKILIKKLNKSIDIPIINESTEKKTLDAIYNLILKTLRDMEED